LKKLRIRQTPLEVSRLAYGCMTLGQTWNGQPPQEETRQAMAAVRTALEEGINFFDHADIYGRGHSEEVFAAVWREVPGLRQQIVLQSKCGIRFEGDPVPGAPHRFDFSYEHIIESVDGSLQRLQTDYLDLLLLHRPDALVEPEEVARAFDDLQQSGKVRYFGVSNHSGAQIDLLRRFVRQPLVVNQLELSVLHNQLINAGIVVNQDEPARSLRAEGTLEYCRLHDITIQPWSPLARGVLFGRVPETWDERVVKTGRLVAALADKYGVSSEAIVVAWLLRHPAGFQPVVGTTKPERIRAVCQADNVELTREEWYALFIAGRGAPLP
jgi:predicted oxidoreductase